MWIVENNTLKEILDIRNKMENDTKCVCGKYCALTPEEKINIYLDSIFGPELKQDIVLEQEQNSTKSSKFSINYNILRIIFGLPGIRYQ